MKKSLVNGVISTQISITDRGLSFGDGVFTTAVVRHGSVEQLTAHLQRLQDNCQRMAINNVNWHKLTEEVASLIVDEQLATLKIVITAGISERGYSRNSDSDATRIVQLSEFPNHYSQWQAKGATLGVSQIKLGLNPLTAGLKHLNRIEQVLIRQELQQTSYDELVVCDLNGNVIECNTANIFWQKDGRWFTSDLNEAGVNGIVRQQILKKMNDVAIVKTQIDELEQAQAMFICNCLMGIVPITQFQLKALSTKSVRPIQDLILNA